MPRRVGCRAISILEGEPHRPLSRRGRNPMQVRTRTTAGDARRAGCSPVSCSLPAVLAPSAPASAATTASFSRTACSPSSATAPTTSIAISRNAAGTDPGQRRRGRRHRRHADGRQHRADPGVRPGRQRHDHAQRGQRRAAAGQPVRRRRQRHAHRRLGRRPALRPGRQRHAARPGRLRLPVRRRRERHPHRRRRRRPGRSARAATTG